ncbi:MAG: hypothetical protein ACE5G0_12045 [Rhodothermales bacterium]
MKTWFVAGCLLFAGSLTAGAQHIPVKTVPVATGNQFLLFPSQNLGMGGVTIAVDDPLADPFVNPAKGVFIQDVHFTSSPVLYGVSMDENREGESSSGRTLPFGTLLRQGVFFGGAMVAWQELIRETPNVCCFAAPALDIISTPPSTRRTSDNIYAFVLAGAQVPGTNLSVGASAFVAGLNGLEGVSLLYSSSDPVKQSGHLSNIRLGLYHRWDDGRSAALTVLHHRFNMTHEMPWWDPAAEDWGTREEHDETIGWAVQAGFQHPLRNGWRIGGQLTGDWKRHPKIPNYDIMQIPRDPGNSSAYNVGLGFSRTFGQAVFGFDLIYEPIWSHTWADALQDTPTTGEGPPDVIKKGDMTVENFFRFDNSLLRLGVQRIGDRFDVAVGLSAHTYRYDLDQQDFVAQFERSQDEHWTEWTGSLGLGFKFAEFQIRYLGLITWGTGRPGIELPWRFGAVDDAVALSSDFVVAPGAPLTLQEARVVTHQVTILVPITN